MTDRKRILHEALSKRETKASDLYTILGSISAKSRVLLRILVLCCGGG